MSYRFLNNPGLVTSLENEEEYVYAHLIKFEKPLASSSQGFVSGKAENYAYLTDGSYNIAYDDGSVDSRGTLNSTQNYIANKILKVGTVNETIEAKASNMSLVLTGNALNTSTVANFTFTSTTITSTVDLVEAGFSTGDVIRFEKLSAANDQEYVRIDSFSNANKTINYTHISGTGITISGTPTEYAIVFASDEISGLANSKQSLDYSSYINREVFIWRAHLNPTTGQIIGSPFLIFKGIITNGSIRDDVTTKSEVTWTLTSHWGDFVQVNGRITSDHAHRALNVNAIPDVEAVLRPEYASDLGFYHAEQAINVIATYQEPVTKYKTKKRGGLAGLFGGTKQIEYTEMVDRDVDLQFNLSAKYIPIVYGVQKISGIPFFAEGDAADAKKVYVAQAICEGPIQGIYDVHIDDSPIICTNSSDFNARNTGDAQVLCVGRADRGDVLSGTSYINKSSFLDIDLSLIGSTISGFLGESSQSRAYSQYALSNNISSAVGGAGIIHENKFNLDSPLTAEVIFHAGIEDQSANSFLVKKASETGFKIQSEYYSTSLTPLEYWGPQHQVLDTAYAVMNFTIAEGETTIPDYDFIVKGKILECYNYDRSYSGVGDHTKFNIGDYVTLRNKEDDSQLGATTVQIIDKWSFYKPDGVLTYRYRFDKNYQLVEENPGLLEDVTSFYMENAATDKWYFAAYNHVPLDTAPVPEPIVDKAFQNTTIKSETADGIAITYNNTTFNYEITGLGVTSIPEFELMSYLKITVFYTTGEQGNSYIIPIDTYTAATGKVTFPATAAVQLSNAYRAINSTYTGNFTVSAADVVKLHTNASTVDNEYTNMYITIKKFDTLGNYTTHFSQILDYAGSTQLAKLALSPSYTVTSDNTLYTFSLIGSDIFSLAPTSAVAEDKRVSINPAIQVLDYLTNKRYGKGLDLDKDIDLESFLATARVCDTRSKVTVQVLESEGSVLQVGDIYKYPSTGALLFQGKIDSVSDIITINGTALREVTFTDVIGKLAYKWNDWRQYTTDTIIWWNGTAFKPTGSGTISEANRDSYITSNAFSDSGTRIVLTKVSGTGSASFNLSTSFKTSNDTNALVDNHLGNPVIKKFTSLAKGFTSTGYSLYDSDDCPYWVYLGWDEPEQRYVTRHQTNLTVDTSQSVFSNINGMLQQFNGILRYSAGKYALSLKSAAPDDSYFTTYTSKAITEDEIIGEVKLDDSGSKKTYNTINANIIDPQNKFGARSITFLNSDYIKQDKGVKKTGNYNVPGISNYFNARINIKQNLDESRYGLTVSFTIDSKGYLLLSGDVIKLSYSRFGWNEKYFRINSLNFTADGLVQVVAEEHNNEAYLIEYLDTGRSAETLEGSNTGRVSLPSPEAPTSVVASTTLARVIEISWINGTNYNPDVFATEIQRATQSDFSDAQLVATVETNTFTDNPPGDFNAGDVTRYYRVRHIYSNTRGTALSKFTNWTTAAAAGTALRTSKTETGLSAVENLDADGQVVTGIERDVSINQGGVTFETTIEAGGPKLRTQGTFFDTDAVTPAGNPGFYLGYATDTDGIGNDDSGYKFFVGNPSGERLVFDGTNLSVSGNISASSGDIGGLTISASSVYVGTGTFNNANTAFYVDDQGQFSLKDSLSWNGTTLSISGQISATTGSIGGFTVGSTDLTAGTGTSHISLSTADGIHLGADAFASAPFSVSLAGALTATNATITGNITATTGTIGGFTVGATDLTAGDATTKVSLSTANGIHLGANAFASAPFSVSPAGALKATSATITGDITANSFTFDGANVSGTLSAANIEVDEVFNIGTINTDLAVGGLLYNFKPLKANNNIAKLDFENSSITFIPLEDETVASVVNEPDSKYGRSYYATGAGSGAVLLSDTEADAVESGDFSYSVWFKSTTTTGDDNARVLTRDDSDFWAIAVAQNQTGNQSVIFYSAPSSQSFDGAPVNEWNHVVLTRSGSTVKGYLNGREVTTYNSYSTAISDRPVVLGTNTEDVINLLANSFIGHIADVKVYEKALSLLEVQSLYLDPTGNGKANIDAGTIGGVTITPVSLYEGTGNFNNADTGFYLDNTGNFSLENKLSFNSSTSTLTVSGDITANNLTFDGASVTGTLAAANIDVSGVITAGGILTDSVTISNNIKIGSGESVFIADSNGIYLGNETFASAEFSVTPEGALNATSATITGDITATNLDVTNANISGTITAPNLIASNNGRALNFDPLVKDSTAWVAATSEVLEGGTYSDEATFTTVANGKVGKNVLRSPTGANYTTGAVYTTEFIPVGEDRDYVFSLLARESATAPGGDTYFGVAFYSDDAAGGYLDTYYVNDLVPGTNAGVNLTSAFGKYELRFGVNNEVANEEAGDITTLYQTAPAGTLFAKLVVFLNVGDTASTTTYVETQDIRIEETLPVEAARFKYTNTSTDDFTLLPIEYTISHVDKNIGYSGHRGQKTTIKAIDNSVAFDANLFVINTETETVVSDNYGSVIGNQNYVSVAPKSPASGFNFVNTSFASRNIIAWAGEANATPVGSDGIVGVYSSARLEGLGTATAVGLSSNVSTATELSGYTGAGNLIGVKNIVSRAGGTGLIYGVYTDIDVFEGTASTVYGSYYNVKTAIGTSNSYILYGYSDSVATNSYGIYITSANENYFGGVLNTFGGLEIGGTSVVDSSRNLKNIASVSLNDFSLESRTTTLATTTQTVIAAYPLASYSGGKFIITAKDGINTHICELLVTHNGSSIVATQYGSVFTSTELATYDVNISTFLGEFRIVATSASTNSTVYKVAATLMEA